MLRVNSGREVLGDDRKTCCGLQFGDGSTDIKTTLKKKSRTSGCLEMKP